MSSHEIPATPEERINAARGYKAALHNPHVSEEAKERAKKMLEELDEDQARQEMQSEGPHHAAFHRHHGRLPGERPGSPQERINAARGYKAALHNPLVSEEGKEHARMMLRSMDEEEAREELYHEKPKSPNRVAGGLKAAQHNPRLSEESHHRAEMKLHEMGYDMPGE
ncbi:Conidiation protein 6-domain-containing protein [Aspergillus varians]